MHLDLRRVSVPLTCALLAILPITAAFAAVMDDIPRGPLPRNVELHATALELKIDPGQERFQGRARISVEVRKATDTLWLHGRDLLISSASIAAEGRPPQALEVQQVDVSGVLKLTAPSALPAGRYLIEMAYEARYGQLQGAYKVTWAQRDYVLTHMEPLGARTAFPCFDEPSFKKPWSLTLVVPAGQVAVANTRLVKEESSAGGWKRFTFARTENLPSYLVAFAVGPWDVVESPAIPPNAKRGTALPLRGIAAHGQGRRMSYTLGHTAAIVEALETYFGTPYPYDKLDLLAAPDFAIGAMENAGLIVYRDTLMFVDDRSPAGVRQSYWITHAHELSHQWFGNLVTMPWWDDTWLKEAFATWLGVKIAGQLEPELHTDRVLMQAALGAMKGDSLASTRRIREPIRDFTDVRSAFDGITYSKGGAVLAMFERYVGEQAFRDGVRRYLRQHAGGNATSADLVDAIAARTANPQGIRAAFASFLEQPGVPLVQFRLDCAEQGKPALELQQTRYVPLGVSVAAGQQWILPLCVRYGGKRDVAVQCQLVSEPRTRMALRTARCPEWAMPNARGAGYYRFLAADAHDREALRAAFGQLDEREQRAYAESLWSGFATGAIGARDYLAAAPLFAASPVPQTAGAPLGTIEWILEHLASDAAVRGQVREFALRTYGPKLDALGLDAQPGESDDQRFVRVQFAEFLADVARSAPLRAELARRGNRVLRRDARSGAGEGEVDTRAVHPDLRQLALVTAAQEGSKPTFEAVLGHLHATQDPELRGSLVAALGSFGDPLLAARARALALQPGELRRNELYNLFGQQSEQPALRAGLRQWLDENFDAVVARLAPAGAGLIGPYSAGACSAAEADEIRAKFEGRLRGLEGGPRILAQVEEAVRQCGVLREAQAASLGKGPF